MSITTTKDVFCDKCGNWTHGDIETTNKKARRLVRGKGWIYTNKQDICPNCIAKIRSQPND